MALSKTVIRENYGCGMWSLVRRSYEHWPWALLLILLLFASKVHATFQIGDRGPVIGGPPSSPLKNPAFHAADRLNMGT